VSVADAFLHRLPFDPSHPEGSTMNEGRFEGKGGLNIFTRAWRPSSKARAAIVLAHGFNAHSGMYGWVADQLVARGIAAYALDHRGRGRSDGERFYVQNFSDYVEDLGSFIKLVKSQEGGAPLYLLGHSAGGVISAVYALDHQAELAGFICESFAHEVPAPDFALAVLKGLSHVAPHAHVLRLKNEDFTRDPKVLAAMNDDPLIAHEIQPTQTIAEMVRADERLKREFPRITLPLLILHGTADKATKPSGSKRFHEMAGSKDKTLKLYEGAFHDLLNDSIKEIVMADILAWLEARVPKA
jgi:alpha-beta hydrolase superfamily lysophospholipase